MNIVLLAMGIQKKTSHKRHGNIKKAIAGARTAEIPAVHVKLSVFLQ